MSKLLDSVLYIIVVISIASLLIERFINLSNAVVAKLNTFKRRNIKARKEFLDQIKTGNTYVSSFFMQINPFGLKIPLKSLLERTIFVILILPIISVIILIFPQFGISYIPTALLFFLFALGLFFVMDDFTLFRLEKNWGSYPFTSLKRVISGIIYVLEQTITLTVFIVLIFFILLLLIGPIDTLNALSRNIYASGIQVLLLIILALWIIGGESNNRNMLIIWAFSKFIKEEDAQVNLIIATNLEKISGYLVGIGNNLELYVENRYHREIPWSSIISVSVDENVTCVKSKIESIDDFFFRLKGKPIEIANYYRAEEDFSFSSSPILISPVFKDCLINNWNIINASGGRVLELLVRMLNSEISDEYLKMESIADLIFIDREDSKSYKIINVDLERLIVEYKEVK